MFGVRHIVAVFAWGAFAAQAVYAGMTPIYESVAEVWQSVGGADTPPLQCLHCIDPLGIRDSLGPCSLSVEFPSGAETRASHTDETRDPCYLRSGTSSLSLCLYAFIGVGLFASPPRLMRPAFGVLLDWYHDGGLRLAKGGDAASASCFDFTPVHGFVQPDDREDGSRFPCPFRMWSCIGSASRGVLVAMAPRGPPRSSHTLNL